MDWRERSERRVREEAAVPAKNSERKFFSSPRTKSKRLTRLVLSALPMLDGATTAEPDSTPGLRGNSYRMNLGIDDVLTRLFATSTSTTSTSMKP